MSNNELLKRSLDNCYFIKTILMLMVVLYHSILFMSDGWSPINAKEKSQALLLFAGWLNSFHIYGFVLVSGFIFCHIKQERAGYKDYKSFVINKVRRLVVPALFITCVWAIPIAFELFDYAIEDIVYRYIIALSPNQLWFSWMLFWVFIISWPLSKYFDSYVGLIIALLLYLVGSFGGHFVPNYFQIWKGCEYVIFFLLGWTIRVAASAA